VDAPATSEKAMSAELTRGLEDVGLSLAPAADRLAAFNTVENTYLSIFAVLGGLGLLVGSMGLGVIVLRNVLERRGELALLRAVGLRAPALRRLVFGEHALLLALGLFVGVVSALIAVLPALRSPGANVPYLSLAVTLLAVLSAALSGRGRPRPSPCARHSFLPCATSERPRLTMNRSGSEAAAAAVVPSLRRSILTGSVGFCLASLAVFATVAFAERWMYARLGLAGAYAVWTALFILLGGAALRPLFVGPGRTGRFFLVFALAFFAYAAGWIGAYFSLRNAAGEWVGSLVGSFLMGLVFAAGFGAARLAPRLCAVLFVANSAGYFVGSLLNNAVGGKAGMLLWGGVYGLCLGAGLGAVLFLAQTASRASR
jgi:hypothetical protein